MSRKPITLWAPKAKLATDGAGATILQYELPPAPSTICPPYQSPHSAQVRLRYVPPLIYFCIKALVEYPDELHSLGPAKLQYQNPHSRAQFDILSALIPTYRPFSPNVGEFDIHLVDPRLWACLIQLYEGLPPVFRQYTLPLSDVHLPLLQAIPSSAHFSLITVLSLRRCRTLTDDNAVELRHLHTLVALDASMTGLGTWGIQRLAKSLTWSDPEDDRPCQRRGPWGLRILYLRDCINVDDGILSWLAHFPLLCVIDLRGTTCRPWKHPELPFQETPYPELYPPAELGDALSRLPGRKLFSHPSPFILNVNELSHKLHPQRTFEHPLNHLYNDTADDESGDERIGNRSPQPPVGRRDVFLPYKYEPPRAPSPPPQLPIINSETYLDEGEGEDGHDGSDEFDEGDTDEDKDRDLEPQPPGPLDMGGSGWGEGLVTPTPPEPDPDFDDGLWMNEIATGEHNEFLEQHGAVIFYAKPRSSGRRTQGDDSVAREQKLLKAREVQASLAAAKTKTDPLMLYRPPPPWHTLPSSPPPNAAGKTAASSTSKRGMPQSVFADAQRAYGPASETKTDTQQLKRKRSGLDETASADQARRRMHALSSLQSMFTMVQKRAENKPTDDGDGKGSGSVPLGRVNPFARSAQGGSNKSTVQPNKRKAPPESPICSSASQSQTREPSVGGSGSSPAVPPRLHRVISSERPAKSSKPTKSTSTGQTSSKPSTSASSCANVPEQPAPAPTPVAATSADASLSSRPQKKLKPITSLTVPDWPNAHHKPLSHHNPKPASIAPPAKAAKQTTLPVVRNGSKSERLATSRESSGAPKEGGSRKEQKRVSAPVATTRRLEMSTTASGKSERAEGKGEGSTRKASGKAKPQPKGGGFDWKTWSAG
ncbi:hypothetical protein C8Q73DRAFT_752507 [Cubamyces lactineus]|nr:hypothetical protein C8Q73DRAFT_752507 [Cubamyces lactineus]